MRTIDDLGDLRGQRVLALYRRIEADASAAAAPSVAALKALLRMPGVKETRSSFVLRALKPPGGGAPL